MFLSRIAIDMENRNAWRALDNPEILHGMVESCFPGDRQRVLWRVDELNSNHYILLLSPDKPDLKPLIRQIGLPYANGEICDYLPLLERIQVGSMWRFRLTANPVMSVPQPGKKRGSVKAITIAAHQRDWLVRQGKQHGFLLKQDQFDVMRSEWKVFRKKGSTLSILGATFEGILIVTDQACFQNALLTGIGRGKAYGLGLMTVMRHG